MKRVLLACYGGGHVQSLIPVARILAGLPGIDLTALGFTTARAAFQRAGINAIGYDSLAGYSDEAHRQIAQPFLPASGHPDVSPAETEAYFAAGIGDLAAEIGEQAARELAARDGRKAFLPVRTFLQYLDDGQYDVVVTSTSPRSELALQRAARHLEVPGIAVSDLFLQKESEYICRSDYAPDVTVISPFVENLLRDRGMPDAHRIHVTGNPAFDSLDSESFAKEAQEVRDSLGLSADMRVVTWIGSAGSESLVGKKFLPMQEVVDYCETFCEQERSFRYCVRRHPSDTGQVHIGPNGFICPDVTIEVCINMSDVMMMETSTVGLQAALLGKPVVTINAGDYPPYAPLGLALDVAELESAGEAIRQQREPDLDRLEYPGIGSAADSIVSIIDSVIGA